MYFSLIIDKTTVDLFKDETISLTRQLKDLQSPKDTYTDFTQSFKIPATDRNNKLFQNFFDENAVFSSWNQNDALPAQIFIHGLPIFDGVVEVLEVDFNMGEPSSYTISFYGKTKLATLSWGELTLREMDWSDYDHIVDNSVVQSSWSGGLFGGKIVWDLKDYGYGFTYSTSNLSNNVRKPNTLDFYDLRPSIRLKDAVIECFKEIGITLTGTLLDRTEFDTWYVTPMAEAGPMVDKFASQFGNVDAETATSTLISVAPLWFNDWQPLPLGDTTISDPSGSWDSTNYIYTIPRSGNYTFSFRFNSVSDPNVKISVKWEVNKRATTYNRTNTGTFWTGDTQVLVLSRLSAGDEVRLVYKTDLNVFITGEFHCLNSPYSLQPSVIMARAFPNTKVVEFVNSFMQMTNAILVPISDTEIEMHNIQDWYNSGAIKEYTQYVDFKTITHKKVPIPKTISFKHKDAETESHDYFTHEYGRKFGDLSFTPKVDFASESINVETIFTVFPPTVLREVNGIGKYMRDTTLQWMGCFDSDIKPTQHEFILFHFQPPSTSTYFYLGTSWLMSSPTSSVFSGTTSSDYSCAFGLEAVTGGDMPVNTLYFLYWNDYVSRLYSTKSRLVIMNINLPVLEWFNMKLNDTIAISGNYYKIQSINYDINREYGTIELLTYPNVEILRVTSSSGNIPTYFDPISANAGITFIRDTEVKLNIAHAVTQGGLFLTEGGLTIPSNTGNIMTLTDNLLSAISLNKMVIYNLDPTPQMFSPSGPTPLTLPQTAVEGDSSKYLDNGMSGEIEIQYDGQYRIYATIAFEPSAGGGGGNNPYVLRILIDGLITEAYAIVSHNRINTINLRMSSTLGVGQKVSLISESGDSGMHFANILTAYLTIESII